MLRSALAIAGSDSGGGAGIQADLKAFARCGVHGTTAITAVTAVARALDELPAGVPIVVDPVMVAESGARLLDVAAQQALIEQILPRASVITPNLSEARALAGRAAPEGAPRAQQRAQDEEVEELARTLLTLGPAAVVITGGHREHTTDVLLQADGDQQLVQIAGERHAGGAAHGSGCTHSSLLAAHLALGHTMLQAARAARVLAGEAVRDGLREVGAGAGPVDVLGLRRTKRCLP
jgi:hydroxymethylpyrimidine/phosphomethylpyrimidine kinase